MEFRAMAISALIIAARAAPAVAQQRVIDGDTMDLNGTRWLLWSIDALESRQACKDGYPATGYDVASGRWAQPADAA
jgi:endonuclease YncB( thermonuclease family)